MYIFLDNRIAIYSKTDTQKYETIELQPQSKKKKEKERCNQLIEKLKDEERKQTDHLQRIMARLKHQKEAWFVSSE